MADQRLLDPPGWDRLVSAGRVAPPDPVVLEQVQRRIRDAAREEAVRALVPTAVPLIRRRRRRLVVLAAVTAVTAGSIVVVAALTGDSATSTVVLASGGQGGPALAPAEYDANTCATGEARTGDPATDVGTLGWMPSDPDYRFEHLLVREQRLNCPAYDPSLGLIDVADDGRLLRFVTVYGPLAAVPWQTNDPPAGEIGTSAEIIETVVQGHRAQLIDHGSPQGSPMITAVWTDAAGHGWTATAGGVQRAELERLLGAMTLTSAGARLADDLADDLADGLTVTSYESVEPEARWDPYWSMDYRDSDGTTYTIETHDRGSPAGSAPWEGPASDMWMIDIRGGTTAHLARWDYGAADIPVTGTLKWQEGPASWVSVMISPYDEEKLIAFAESLAMVAPDDPRLDQAE